MDRKELIRAVSEEVILAFFEYQQKLHGFSKVKGYFARLLTYGRLPDWNVFLKSIEQIKKCVLDGKHIETFLTKAVDQEINYFGLH